MEIYILDANLNRVGMVDVYESFSWTTSYNDIGSFELHCGMQYFNLLQTDMLLQNSKDNKHNGVIEYVAKETNEDGIETLVVKGRMAEILLERRVALGDYVFESAQPAQIACNLIERNAIEPNERKITFLEIGNVVNADGGTVNYGCSNEQVLTAIKDICQEIICWI
ncbi:Gp37-like protein [Anaerovorax sp. IOR16]|uniref:Gp37-like protein n=1 Tax=Anaerovorax sp. IOR16 TaxID=2773458 RepID=UPI0019D0A000|nr:hypothetical protein [Anaerovorax sp. IOR16]